MLRGYVTDCLMAISQNTAPLSSAGKLMEKRFAEEMGWVKADSRTGDEIAMDIIRRAGLKVQE